MEFWHRQIQVDCWMHRSRFVCPEPEHRRTRSDWSETKSYGHKTRT